MIVINPPAPPAGVLPHTPSLPEHAAVEWALKIARVRYSSERNTGSVEWMRCLATFGPDTSFVVHGVPPTPINVLRPDQVEDGEQQKHFTLDGLDGLLAAAAMIVTLPGVEQAAS